MNQYKHLRTKRHILQAEAAEILGVHKSTVSKWETGLLQPSDEMLPKICDLYKCTIEDLKSQTVQTGKQSGKQPDFLTPHQLAERWNCCYKTAWEFSHRKGSNAIKLKRKILIPLKDIEKHESVSILVT